MSANSRSCSFVSPGALAASVASFENVTRKLGYKEHTWACPNPATDHAVGAVYRRTELTALARQIASYECAVCGSTLESWNTAWIPAFRLITGQVISEQSQPPDS